MIRIGVLGCLVLGSACALVSCSDQNAQVKIEQLQRENDSLQRENMGLKGQVDQLKFEATAKSRPEAQPVKGSREPQGEPKSVTLSAGMKKAGIQAQTRGRDTAFVLGADDLFEKRSVKVDKAGAHRLDLLADYIKKNFPAAEIRVEGHTDSDPIGKLKDKFQSNQELSAARADAVMDYLVNTSKLDAGRIKATGHADTQPLDLKDKKKNRRVEIVIVQ